MHMDTHFPIISFVFDSFSAPRWMVGSDGGKSKIDKPISPVELELILSMAISV